jgi:hypothetical protein
MTDFGGSDCFSTFFNDVWVLSNANGMGGTPAWTQLTPSGTPPAPSGYHTAVYDPGSNRMIVFGVFSSPGISFSNQVWVLTNANGLGGTPAWILLAPVGPAIPATSSQGAVYDTLLNRMTIFGGGSNPGSPPGDRNDTWVLSDANGLGGSPVWTQLSPSGVLPAPREWFPAVYDPATNRMVIFGGASALDNFNDTWVLTNANGELPFSLFKALAAIDLDGNAFAVAGEFTLGTGSNGIAPPTEPVQLKLGTFSTTIPAGSFKKGPAGGFTFAGVINGVKLAVVISPTGKSNYLFAAVGSRANLTGTANPVTVGLTIGDDTGSASIKALFE